MVKSIAVVALSYILSVVLVFCMDPILTRIFPSDFAKGNIPSDKALMVSTVLFVLVSIFCAWVCARFAPSNAAKHVLWFFVIGELMGIVMTIPGWNNGWPHWYALSWLLTWPVSCWIGLKLAGARAEIATASV